MTVGREGECAVVVWVGEIRDAVGAHAVRELHVLGLLPGVSGTGWRSAVGQELVAGSVGGLERRRTGIEAAGRDLHVHLASRAPRLRVWVASQPVRAHADRETQELRSDVRHV